jgi:hypothetical protein
MLWNSIRARNMYKLIFILMLLALRLGTTLQYYSNLQSKRYTVVTLVHGELDSQ